MGTFFHGWRRQAGCVTLVPACGFMGLWARSRSFEDRLMLHFTKNTKQELLSSIEGLVCLGGWVSEAKSDYYNYKGSRVFDYVRNERQITVVKNFNVVSYRGFAYKRMVFAQQELVLILIAIPHWSVVLPLTSLSAWLLLRRPRPKAAVHNDTKEIIG